MQSIYLSKKKSLINLNSFFARSVEQKLISMDLKLKQNANNSHFTFHKFK